MLGPRVEGATGAPRQKGWLTPPRTGSQPTILTRDTEPTLLDSRLLQMRHHGVDGLSCGSFLGHSIFDLAIKHDLVDKRTTTSATIQLDMYPWTFCLHTICWTNWTATSAPSSHGFFLERGRTLPLPWTSPGQKSPGHSALILGLEAIMHRTVFWNPQTCDTGRQIRVFRAVGRSFLRWPR